MSKSKIKAIGDKRVLIRTKDKEKSPEKKDIKYEQLPNQSVILENSLYIHNRMSLYKTMLELFPDLELCGEVLASSIVNPKDSVDTKISISSTTTKISDATKFTISDAIETLIEGHYKLDKKLYKMVQERNVMKGAICYLVLSEATVEDHIMNNIRTSFKGEDNKMDLAGLLSTLGIDATPKDVNDNKSKITFTSDTKILFARKTIDLARESYDITDDKLKNIKLMDDFFIDSAKLMKREIDGVTNSNRASEGRPLFKKIPMEAVCPIINKNDPEDHKRYIILLDGEGLPISNPGKMLADASAEEIDHTIMQTSKSTSTIVEKASSNMVMADAEAPPVVFDRSTIEELVNEEITNYLTKEGAMDVKDISYETSILDTMFERALAQQTTTVLYVNKENLIYFADKYNENGIGVSVLDELFYNTSMRALLETSKIHAEITNNIPRKDYSIKLDDDDQDPAATSKQALDYIMQGERNILLNGLIKPGDLSRWSTSLGITARFSHPKLPDVSVALDENTRSMNVPDSSMADTLSDRAIMKFGLSPEMIQDGRRVDFAISEIFKNSMRAKRMMRKQESFELDLTRLIRALVKHDGIITKELKEKILHPEVKSMKALLKDKDYVKSLNDDDLVERMLQEYLLNMSVELPKPDAIADNKIKDDYEDFIDVARNYLELRLSEDSIPEEVYKEFGEKTKSVIDMLVGVLANKWLKKNGHMKELTALFTVNDSDNLGLSNVFLEQHDFMVNLEESFTSFLKSEKKVTRKSAKKFDKIENEEDEAPEDVKAPGEDETPEENKASEEE